MIDRFLTLRVIHPLQQLAVWNGANRRRLPVLMYHSISDEPEAGVLGYYRLCTSPRRFAEQMLWLREHGFHGVTLSEGLSWLEQGDNKSQGAIGARPVAITFDDGFHDVYQVAFPILRSHGFHATVYLPTGFIGSSRLCFQPRGGSYIPGVSGRACLIWSEVAELASASFEIGAHTVTHPVLSSLLWPEIESEVRSCKEVIEQHIGRPVRAFAHPYAFPAEQTEYVKRLSEVLQAAGYASAVTTRVGCVYPGADPFRLRRVPINSGDDCRLFEAKLRGSYNWVGCVQSIARKFRRAIRSSSCVESCTTDPVEKTRWQ